MPIARTYYTKFFNTKLCEDGQPEIEEIPPFTGPPRALNRPIAQREIEEAVKKVRNGRTCGPDGTSGELYRYGSEQLSKTISSIYNNVFETHTLLTSLHKANIAVLNKPNKTPCIENTRAITLFNIDRKAFELILLERITHKLIPHIPNTQCAYQSKRSTTEVVWVHRMLGAMAVQYYTRFNVMGIDLSKAFDCVVRAKLLQQCSTILDEDEMRMLQMLLSDTQLSIRMQHTESDYFSTLIGIPQGGGLSPVMFILYLAKCLNTAHDPMLQNIRPQDIYMHLTYADDDDLAYEVPYDDDDRPRHTLQHPEIPTNLQHIHLQQASTSIQATLHTHNLQMNMTKLEWTTIEASTYRSLRVRKLGSMIGDTVDMEYRISRASQAFRTMYNTWRGTIPLSTRIRIYKCYVLPHYLYNIAALGLSHTMIQKRLDIAHRKHLRIICQVWYPNMISNTELYTRTASIPISHHAINYRWSFLGHILRLHINGQSSMCYDILYTYTYRNIFSSNNIRHCGDNVYTLPHLLNDDLSYLPEGIKLQCPADLERLTTLAQDREAWTNMTSIIYENRIKPKNEQIIGKIRRIRQQRTKRAKKPCIRLMENREGPMDYYNTVHE